MAVGLERFETVLLKRRRTLHKLLYEYNYTQNLLNQMRDNISEKNSWVSVISTAAGVQEFDWQNIGAELSKKIELENEIDSDFAANDRDVATIQKCLSNRNQANDKLLMSVIGIRAMLNFREENTNPQWTNSRSNNGAMRNIT